MTNWLPTLDQVSGPVYVRLAERIERDIREGALPPGAKLPPQRDLAYDLGVTVGTVGRAYALVRERGLVTGEVGRGTFVLGASRAETVELPRRLALPTSAQPSSPSGMLRLDTTAAPDVGQAARIGALSEAIALRHGFEVVDYTRHLPDRWREAGAAWLRQGDWQPDPESVVPALGLQPAIMSIIATVTVPGDRIVFDRLTYSSIARSAALIGRRPIVVGGDANGIDPDELDHVCAQQHPKLAFLITTLHNPTLVTMPAERREAVAEVARRHNLWLIEDAIYGVMVADQPPALATYAPERTFHVGGLSKAVAAGLRGGWASCPAQMGQRVANAHKMLTGGVPFLLAELSAELVLSGEARRIMASVKAEVAAREKLARQAFEGLDFASDPVAPFLWLKLPEPWMSATFRQAAAREGVLVDDEDEYKPTRSEEVYHRVRIGFSCPPHRADVEAGFATLRRLMDSGGSGYDTYG